MKKRLLALLLSLLMIASLAACGGGSGDGGAPADNKTDAKDDGGAQQTPPPAGLSLTNVEDTLTVGSTGEPTVLDPQNQNDSPSGFNCMQMYETLIARDNETMEYMPQLAESWEYLDDTTIRFHLRDDVYFHDGSHFTANDVKFTFMRGKDCTLKAYSFEPFDCDASAVVDEYTFDLKTKEPFPAAFDYLVGNAMLIVGENAVNSAANVDEYGRNPTGGTGPWKFKEWIAGDRVVYERNEDYYGEKPYFSTMVVRNISDDTTRALSLEAGEIDISIKVAPTQIDTIENSETAYLVRFLNFVNNYLGFNCKKEPFNDVRVRKAMRYALDLDAMTEVAYSGAGLPSDSIFTKALSAYEPAPEELTYTYDVEKAKSLLAEAGYPDGFACSLWVNESQTRIDMAEMLQNAWGQIGIKVSVEVMEFGSYLEKIHNGEHDMFILGFTSGGNDSAFARDNFYTEDGFVSNSQGYSNPEYDRLADLAYVEMDPEKRHEYEIEIQNLLRDELPWIPLRCDEAIYGVRSTLTGMDKDAQAKPQFRNIRPLA